MSIPRGLSEEEAAVWAKLAQSVTPMQGRMVPRMAERTGDAAPIVKPARPQVRPQPATQRRVTQRPKPEPLTPNTKHGLDGHWERKLRAGNIAPDVTLDLHGHTLDSAHTRLETGLAQALAMGARVVLLIAGKSRPVDPADRGERRGAIRAKILDWLAAGPHGSSIAAIRKAHRRHGGDGALYLILKRPR